MAINRRAECVRNHQLQKELDRIARFAIVRTDLWRYSLGKNGLSRAGGRLIAG